MTSEDRVTPIGELKPGMRNVSCVFIVIDRGSTSHTKDGSLVRKCRVADRSGSILFSVWNEEADAIEGSDIVRLSRGYASVWKGDLVLYCGKYGLVEKLGEFTMVYSEVPDMSVWEPPANDQQSSSSSSQQQQHGPSTPVAHSPHSLQSRPHSLSRNGSAPTARNGNSHHHHHPSTPAGHPPPLLDASWSNEDSPSTLHNHISHNDHTSHRHNHHHSSHTKSAYHRHAPSSNGHTRYHPYPSSHQSLPKEHWR